jgi:hypothetical protein
MILLENTGRIMTVNKGKTTIVIREDDPCQQQALRILMDLFRLEIESIILC